MRTDIYLIHENSLEYRVMKYLKISLNRFDKIERAGGNFGGRRIPRSTSWKITDEKTISCLCYEIIRYLGMREMFGLDENERKVYKRAKLTLKAFSKKRAVIREKSVKDDDKKPRLLNLLGKYYPLANAYALDSMAQSALDSGVTTIDDLKTVTKKTLGGVPQSWLDARRTFIEVASEVLERK